MHIVANTVIGLIAALHIRILFLEMFWWTRPQARRVFGTSQEFAEATKIFAANQGLYNGFLAAGLIWGIISGLLSVKIFFLSCVFMAGVFGGMTFKRSILYIQGLPALIGIIMCYYTL